MPRPLVSREEFIELYNTLGPAKAARRIGCDSAALHRRARYLRSKGHKLESPNAVAGTGGYERIPSVEASHRAEVKIEKGFALVASDAHYAPGETTLMHHALLWACREFKPKLIVLNGDVMDFSKISRHAPIGWENRPEVQQEIEWAQEKTHEIALACGRGTEKIWNLGNHDARFETRLATLAPEYAKVHGVHLKDHFPAWRPAWSTYVNGHLGCFSLLIKHRFRGGIHAVHNNMLWTGNHIVTGHLHSAQVRALTYYNERTIWGCDSGCVAEPSARAFRDYTEDNPKNWRSGFAVLRWENWRLLQPQLVLKHDEKRVQVGYELVTP